MVMITNIFRLQKRLDTNQESELPRDHFKYRSNSPPIILKIFGEFLLL